MTVIFIFLRYELEKEAFFLTTLIRIHGFTYKTKEILGENKI